MKKEMRDTALAVAAALVVMVAMPLSYRAWRHFHPQPEAPRRTLTDFIAKVSEDRAARLLRTPLSKWTEADGKAEPMVRAWLEAHATTILPWEWTDEARRKDPAGYLKLWAGLFEEQKSLRNRRLRVERANLKRAERDFLAAETVYVHRTNQIARIVEYASTNVFPMTVKVERLSKGVFWGWNTNATEVRFGRREDLYGGDGEAGWLANERKMAECEARALALIGNGKKQLEGRIEALEKLCSRHAAIVKLEEMEDGARLLELCRALNAAAVHGDE